MPSCSRVRPLFRLLALFTSVLGGVSRAHAYPPPPLLSRSRATGTESGGHGPAHDFGAPLSALTSSLASHVPNPSSPPFVLGAGGLASPSSIAAALAPGILAGVVPGTALCVADEALLPHAQKELLVRSSMSESVRGMSWDEARGTLGWPEGVDGRGIRNRTSDEAREVAGSEEGRERYSKAVKEGDVERVVTWAGAFSFPHAVLAFSLSLLGTEPAPTMQVRAWATSSGSRRRARSCGS